MLEGYSYGWFNDDLHYKYVRFLLKDLSHSETEYLSFLRDGLDTQTSHVFTFLDLHYSELNDLDTLDDWLHHYEDSWLEMVLITLMNQVLDANKGYITNFYNQGSNLAYSHMGKDKLFLGSDRRALDNLISYTNGVVESINSEYRNGLVNKIGEHIENDSLDSLRQELLTLTTKPLESPFSVDTRCIFATKTEYARGVNTGLLQSYSNFGVDQYDWVTSGLPNTCKRCLELEDNSPYTINEIMEYACPHPNCVCSFKARLPKVLYLSDNPIVVDLTPKIV